MVAGCGVSECAPQPYSLATTWPSADISLAHTPNSVPSEPGQRQVEAAVAADPAGGPRHRRIRDRSRRRSSARAASMRPHWLSTCVGRSRPRPRPRRVRRRPRTCSPGTSRGSSAGGGQQIAGPEVAGLDALLPGHPLRRQQRRRAGDQDDFADRGVIGAGIARPPRRPTASPGSRAWRPGTGASRRSDRRSAAPRYSPTTRSSPLELHDRGARSVDRTHQHGGEFGRRLRLFGLEVLAACSAGSIMLSIAIQYCLTTRGAKPHRLPCGRRSVRMGNNQRRDRIAT